MRRIVGSAALLVLVAVPLGACSQQQASPPSPVGGVKVGEIAPDFTLPSASGGKVTLSDFEGKAVLLYFSMGPG